jgi:hypothetical protein
MREVQVGDVVMVPMKVTGFESQGPGRRSATKVKMANSQHPYDHRLTRSQIQLRADLTWPRA